MDTMDKCVVKQNPVAGIVERLRSGELDLIEYITTLCNRIEAAEPTIEAIVEGTYDREQILNTARDLLEQYPNPADRPSMFGLPIGTKDIIFTKDFPTKCGSQVPSELFDTGRDGETVQKLKQAGAIIMCKTVTTEFAYRAAGPTRNPFDIERTPGGSSQGSAAGVALGYYPFALGSQTIGSTIRPGSYCGTVAMMPSYGRTFLNEIMAISSSLDHLGLFCQHVHDLRVIAPVLISDWEAQQRDGRIRKSPKDIVFGVLEGNGSDTFLDQVTPNCLAHFRRQVSLLERSGFQTKRIPNFLPNMTPISDRIRRLAAAEIVSVHPFYEEYREFYHPFTVEFIEEGLTVSPCELGELRLFQLRFRDRLEQEMKEAEVDFWICPASYDHATLGLEDTGNAGMNGVFTLSGQPVITLPIGKDPLGLPIGLQVVGLYQQDEELLDVCELIMDTVDSSQVEKESHASRTSSAVADYKKDSTECEDTACLNTETDEFKLILQLRGSLE